jgi:hypothetical protein
LRLTLTVSPTTNTGNSNVTVNGASGNGDPSQHAQVQLSVGN